MKERHKHVVIDRHVLLLSRSAVCVCTRGSPHWTLPQTATYYFKVDNSNNQSNLWVLSGLRITIFLLEAVRIVNRCTVGVFL